MINANPGRPAPKAARPLNRYTLFTLLDAALEEKSYRFARQAAMGWLAAFPGDLEGNAYLAKIFKAEEKSAQAQAIWEKITTLDPENLPAYQSLVDLYQGNLPAMQTAAGCAYVLGDRKLRGIAPDWAVQLRQAIQRLNGGELQEAESIAYQVMAQRPDLTLAAVVHLRIIQAQKDRLAQLKFAEIYHQRWPESLPFVLALSELKMESGEEAQAVNLLHQCVASDAAGQVAERWWGPEHPYRPLWPEKLETTMDLPVPSEVAQRLGWNRLPAQREQALVAPIPLQDLLQPVLQVPAPQIPLTPMAAMVPAKTDIPTAERENGKLMRRARQKSDTAKGVEKEFERLAKRMKQPVFAKADGRYPMYVVCSTLAGLNKQYGEATGNVLVDEMQRLADAAGKKLGWGGLVFLPDDPAHASRFNLKPVPAGDPWKLKLALVDLDHALEKKGARIGALLLVGGPEIVPFHRLPNPAEDMDDFILSDNPYGTLDSNYFVPEWPVGRMPGEAGPDAGLLLQQIRQAVQLHHQNHRAAIRWTPVASLWTVWANLFRTFSNGRGAKNFGYSAAVWKNSSLETFRSIGEGRSLLVSPPDCSGSFDSSRMTASTFGFYNLHGLPDTNEWYGQREASDPVPGPDYPVAMKSTDLVKNGKTPQVIFTEACYGGLIQGKSERDSIAMRFLAVGAPVVIGSTCTSYGAVSTPLVAADLLAFLFWKYLREGYNAGEALLQAKIAMVREMTQRQGYLDGEDQKTLISFVLYGDPLYQASAQTDQPKQYVRQRSFLKVKTIGDGWEDRKDAEDVPEATLTQVKQALAPYLPGLERAEVSVQEQELSASPDGGKLAKHFKAKSKTNRRTVVTFKKPVEVAQKTYFQFARVTLDGRGKMIKMVLSR
jgi:hypothetical protein